MNMAQINTDPETGYKLPKSNKGWITPTNHRYNLRPQPTESNRRYIMMQDGQQSANKKLAKGQIKYVFAHSPECHTLEWLGEESCQHVLSRAICDFHLPLFYLVCHKKVPYVEEFSTHTARCLTILR